MTRKEVEVKLANALISRGWAALPISGFFYHVFFGPNGAIVFVKIKPASIEATKSEQAYCEMLNRYGADFVWGSDFNELLAEIIRCDD